jgi:stage II sporulation protein AA (anti-sigma F factor antagonist)
VLDDHLARAVSDGIVHVVLDTRNVQFADSTFVSAVIRARDVVLPRGGSVRILAPPPPVRRLLEITAVSALPGVEVVDG